MEGASKQVEKKRNNHQPDTTMSSFVDYDDMSYNPEAYRSSIGRRATYQNSFGDNDFMTESNRKSFPRYSRSRMDDAPTASTSSAPRYQATPNKTMMMTPRNWRRVGIGAALLLVVLAAILIPLGILGFLTPTDTALDADAFVFKTGTATSLLTPTEYSTRTNAGRSRIAFKRLGIHFKAMVHSKNLYITKLGCWVPSIPASGTTNIILCKSKTVGGVATEGGQTTADTYEPDSSVPILFTQSITTLTAKQSVSGNGVFYMVDITPQKLTAGDNYMVYMDGYDGAKFTVLSETPNYFDSSASYDKGAFTMLPMDSNKSPYFATPGPVFMYKVSNS